MRRRLAIFCQGILNWKLVHRNWKLSWLLQTRKNHLYDQKWSFLAHFRSNFRSNFPGGVLGDSFYTVIIREAISEKQPLGKKLLNSYATVKRKLKKNQALHRNWHQVFELSLAQHFILFKLNHQWVLLCIWKNEMHLNWNISLIWL